MTLIPKAPSSEGPFLRARSATFGKRKGPESFVHGFSAGSRADLRKPTGEGLTEGPSGPRELCRQQAALEAPPVRV
jgi:hypothetical protein